MEVRDRSTADRSALPESHRVTLDQRRRLTVTAVSEVLRVDETGVALRVGPCVLIARGEGLKLRQMTPDDGRVDVQGKVDSLSYETASGGRLRRLFG